MQVQAQTSFVGYDGNGIKYRVDAGTDFPLPLGVDWLEKGLVIPMQEQEETPVPKTVKRGKK